MRLLSASVIPEFQVEPVTHSLHSNNPGLHICFLTFLEDSFYCFKFERLALEI